MTRNFIRLILAVFICPLFLCALDQTNQETAPTYDPFSSGSFYAEGTPTAEPDAAKIYPGRDGAEMVFIPEGPFTMGADGNNVPGSSKPAHEVYLDGYWIDKYEVTNAQFAKCAAAGYCFAPRDLSSATRPDYYTDPDFADYPVIHVDRNQADAYCTWAGKRLPTEAEWEKAARGTESFIYPWGNSLPDELPAQINLFESGDTAPVDSHPDGVSPYGVYNMEGNVWEWTADSYDRFYYSKSPYKNPRPAAGSNDYVIRGYSWAYPFHHYEITARNSVYILNHTYDLGFRCAY